MNPGHPRATLLLASLVVVLGCQSDRLLNPVNPPSGPPGVDAIAVRLLVDVEHGTVLPLPDSPGTGTEAADPGRAFAILGTHEVGVTATNLVRSAPANNMVTVTFDAAVTNRLTSASLVRSTFPGTSTTGGLVLFPFRVTQATGGAAASVIASLDWNGDGSAGSGAPRNFFNDFGCPGSGTTSDCYRWEQYPAPLGPGETTAAQRVGFTLPKAITSFTVQLVLAADIRNDLPAVARIGVTPSSYVMNNGFPASFTAVAYDALNNPLSWPTLTWTTADITALEFQYGSALVGVITGSSQVVHGRKVGQTSFTVSSGGVSVVVPVDIQVNTIVLVQPYILPDSTLDVGEQVQAQASVKDNSGQIVPGFNPTWSTSDPNVATVDPTTGLITAVGVGTVNITATAAAASGVIPISVSAPALAVVTGNVTDLDGQPVAGATISELGNSSTTTDAAGNYSLSLPPGVYQISADKAAVCYRATWSSGFISAGQTIARSFVLDCPFRVSGTVSVRHTYPGTFPGGLTVSAAPQFPGGFTTVIPIQPDGSFLSFLASEPPGWNSVSYDFSLQGVPGGCAPVSSVQHYGAHQQQAATLAYSLEVACGPITITVRVDDGGSNLSSPQPLIGAPVTLTPQNVSGNTDGQGRVTFTLPGAALTTRPDVDATPAGCINGWFYQNSPQDLLPGDVVTMTVNVDCHNTGALQGTIRTALGNPVPNIRVSAAGRIAFTDLNGHWGIAGLPATLLQVLRLDTPAGCPGPNPILVAVINYMTMQVNETMACSGF